MHKKAFSFAKIVFEIRTTVFIELMITFFLLYFSVTLKHSYVIVCVWCILLTNLMRGMVICGTFHARRQHQKQLQCIWAAAVSLVAGLGLFVAAIRFFYAPQAIAGPKKTLFVAAMSGVLCILSIPDILSVWKKRQIQLRTYRCLSLIAMVQEIALVIAVFLTLLMPEESLRYLAAVGIFAAVWSVVWSGGRLVSIRSQAKTQVETGIK